jgi:hypothetical protein
MKEEYLLENLIFNKPSKLLNSLFFETGSHCAAQASLKLGILLLQPPDYKKKLKNIFGSSH